MDYSPRILIIDDNQGIHRDFDLAFLNETCDEDLLASEARVFGDAKVSAPAIVKPAFELVHALNGREGIDKVKEAKDRPFQLAFVDIRMPGIDGVETVERIWKIDPAIQIVFCTAYADYSWDDLASRLGPTDKCLVLKKPFDYIEVVQMASTLSEKWVLARQAALKLEQMELLVAQRTQRFLELQRFETERLRELDQMKLRFFASMSHELRTPLTLILGPLEQAIASGKADSEHAMMHRNAERLLRLINQMSDFHRLEAGDLKLDMAQADLIAFLRGVVQTFVPIASQQKVDLAFHCKEKSRITCFDADKLGKVLFNLLSDALKFTPENGQVSLWVEFNAEAFEIVLEDTGVGMDASRLARAFDNCNASNASLPRPDECDSMGLVLAQKLVTLHGGTLKVERPNGVPGEHAKYPGTRFIARIPLDNPLASESRDQAAEPVLSSNADPSAADKELPLVLLVEDNADVCLYISQGLGAHFRVATAVDGQQGIENAREMVPDLIIANIALSRVDGLELCQRLKNDELASHIPVILLGTDGSEDYQVKALEAGAEDYLTKPFSPSLLRARVENLLQARRRTMDSQKSTLQPRDIASNQVDVRFLRRATEIVENHMSDFEFDVEGLAQKIFMSRRQLLRKLKAVSNCSPNVFIRSLRLKRAAQLLRTSGMTVTEITYAVGFSDLKHFRTVFREQFGVSPAEYSRTAEEESRT